jgi:hypothetical protein
VPPLKKKKKKKRRRRKQSQPWWYMPVIPATQKAEPGKSRDTISETR